MSIIESLRQIGATASGATNNLGPSSIADIGFKIFMRVLVETRIWAPIEALVGLTLAVIVLVIFALIGINMLLLVISGWILAYAGCFFLGFGGSRWTSDMAIGYFRSVLNIAAQLFAMVLLVGIGRTFIDTFYLSLSEKIRLDEMVVLLIAAVVNLVLVTKIPPLIGSLAGGNTSALGNGYGVGALVSAAVTTAAGISSAGAAMAGVAANAAGASQALMAAFKNASSDAGSPDSKAPSISAGNHGSTVKGASEPAGGAGTLASAMGDSPSATATDNPRSALTDWASGTTRATDMDKSGVPDEESEYEAAGSRARPGEANGADEKADAPSQHSDQVRTGTAGSKADSSEGAGSPKHSRSAATKIAQVIGGTTSNLAQGALDVAQAKLDDLKKAAQDRVSKTTGGKIAAAINARREAALDVSESAEIDSLSAGNEAVDANAEVAAFRDRDDRKDS